MTMDVEQETDVHGALVHVRFWRNPGGSILEDTSLVGVLVDEMVIDSLTTNPIVCTAALMVQLFFD